MSKRIYTSEIANRMSNALRSVDNTSVLHFVKYAANSYGTLYVHGKTKADLLIELTYSPQSGYLGVNKGTLNGKDLTNEEISTLNDISFFLLWNDYALYDFCCDCYVGKRGDYKRTSWRARKMLQGDINN